MGKIKLTINNRQVEAYEGKTILEVARENGIHIPTLCYLKDYTGTGACRVCQVEVEGARNLCAACVYPVREGMVVKTNSMRALDARRRVVELIVSNHSKDCLSCIRNTNCELQRLCQELGVREDAFKGQKTVPTFDEVSPGVVRDTSKCILCGRCVAACQKHQGLGVLDFMERGFKTKIGPVFDRSFNDVNCMQCGQCINVCPVGALHEKEEIHNVIAALNDPNMHVVVQTAPAVRASLGEEFGMPIGTRVTGKMVAALKLLGFDKVYDTNFGADLTIMEEGYEFIHRVQEGGVLPMITSCSPGWINYCEKEYPDLLDHLSTCKSPHMMLGAMIKSHYAKTYQLDPKNIYVVSIMPCVAKKGEKERPQMIKDEMKDVDAVLTTRELGKLIKMFGVNFVDLKDEEFDQDMFGEYTGAAVIFGASGGVMEAALRTVVDVLTSQDLDNIEYHAVRGQRGLKEASLKVGDLTVNVAVAHSMQIAKPLLDDIRAGKSKYHFIEIMGCPGGCINGGGQSYVNAMIRNSGFDFKGARAKALYDEDRAMPARKSHKNTQIQKLYEDFLGHPNSHLAHSLLHTTYEKKDKYK
ncbi:MAG: NADH-dependent [FeFe] hydrogenase, group A6 [Longibaculum muris]|uniref:NAD(P)-dependent iron-only hydrogenase catalytic subunit n=1 Tax=Longibaculum muris TaxID=1796628 RepID=A0A4R3YG07_9FIRM|nr:NADH-dependent [FeFe] hydrogenase, group A6 [Longibaculum muris]MBS5368279.1 [FeFe] hydrogenase, group A [Coprobacillus cateniformis]MCR1889270.1 NADH-dependent [FeFe] hydrogenase, group A6 [Longibaculum muris]MED9812934.1 NADH-dependent [FeFe] hydrogenase, group A6 [Longibaculum muris]TCV91515.1 NAD(P)-dependent iron-only hydrogenase catalytic subunit [Longibaculum muris]